ncbi:SpoIID/LytB domain-containing protein [Candidatus Bathyarchaeota archaeon]|nr:SpoIID/LytB domain-containing protein [Candidatus Bathyarchaeota archaeon]
MPTIPSTIRVLRTATGEIEDVNFKDYVKNVLPNEWYASFDLDALKAGAMAVKTYAWYWTMNERYPGESYDVRDDTWDQVYKPQTSDSRTDQAVEETWNWLMLKNGEISLVRYDSGTQGSPNPIQAGLISQWGTQYWAEMGKDWQWILHYYYDPMDIMVHDLVDGIQRTEYSIAVGGSSFQVVTVSNSSVYGCRINTTLKELCFNVTGTSGTVGFCNVTFPTQLLGGPYVVLMDGSPRPVTITYDATHSSVYFIYSHSSRQVQIIGMSVVPEFPTMAADMLVLTTLALILFITKRSLTQYKAPDARLVPSEWFERVHTQVCELDIDC